MVAKSKTPSITFEYEVPASVVLTMPLVRKTLRTVQEQLLAHEINGGKKKLCMTTVTDTENTCGMAACIGGWTSLFLLGFDKTLDMKLENPADELFEELMKLDELHGSGRLRDLFYCYDYTEDYDEPNVAATAIKRYLAGNAQPWPRGEMPNILPYTKAAPRKR